ncbi:MAG: response regulator transcription factor [Sinobacteraceae bacterium]|nr:response regulator transcription factor [Nevskiaceae bacterium]
MKILLIEDDSETADFVTNGLVSENHTVFVAADGREGLGRARGEQWDLLIVDRMLPLMDGLTLVRELRNSGASVPILFLTTLGGVDDRVNGLNAGADDYLVKPFSFAELLARVAALGRRRPGLALETTLTVADLEINLLTRTVTRAAVRIDLLPREFLLLEYLMRHMGQIVTRTMLLEKVWDVHFDPNTTVIETHISRLRSKIDRGHATQLIHTLRGVGYTLNVQNPAVPNV